LAKKKEKNIFRRITGWIFKALLTLVLAFILFSVTQVVFVRFINPPFTVPIVALWTTNLFSSQKEAMPYHEWRYLKDISPSLIRAVMAGEDQKFMTHHGFDLVEISKAYEEIKKNKTKRARGASTITMQLARTLFLWKGRNMIRKGLEGYYTVLLEMFLSKTRIMELYLNMVDWGTGIMGAEAASRNYYHISARDLTDYQAATLAAILPNPHKWSPTDHNAAVKAHMDLILRYMGDMHL
jgi:monofunctional glycosyltransferase